MLYKSEHLKKYYMKKLLYSLFAVFLTASLLGWNWQQSQHPVVDKGEVIECLNMETQQAYQIEAVQPAFAAMHPAPLVVSPETLLGKMTNFTAADGKTASAYFIASKKKSNKWLIVIQEWWGLNDNIKLEADKYYTDLGDVNVMAVDMYDGKVAATPDSAMKLMRGADMGRMTAIIQGAIKHAGSKANIYSVGWCFGGMWSLQTAILAGPQAKGTVMYYGRPESNMDKLKSIQCDVIGFFGNLDQSPSPAMVNEFEANMKLAGKNLAVNRYEAGHGFANPSNPSYNAAAKADAYTKAIAFLKAH
jgi:carboxymethylenebutenolidase